MRQISVDAILNIILVIGREIEIDQAVVVVVSRTDRGGFERQESLGFFVGSIDKSTVFVDQDNAAIKTASDCYVGITIIIKVEKQGTGAMRVSAAANPEGRVMVLWLDKRTPGSGYAVWGAGSSDRGNTFGPNVRIQDTLGDAVA